MKKLPLFTLFFLIIVICIFLIRENGLQLFKPYTVRPISYLTYNDLVNLSKQTKITGYLSLKLQKQLTTPYVVNISSDSNSLNRQYLRLAQWNIERGLRSGKIQNILSKKISLSNKELRDFVESDIISLNEADIGVPRTNYKNVVSELAASINYNYAFTTEFIELGPIIYKEILDPKQYLGLHGSAILSRYPIISARILKLPQCYNWFEKEISMKSPLEYGRRVGAKAVFKVQINNEPRRGGRNALIVDIKLPNDEIITVVSTHLEDRCYSSCRLKQIKYLLENLKYLKRPIVIAGDFNTTTTDTAPTSVKKEIGKRIKDPHFIARQFALALIPGFQFGVGSLAAGTIRGALHYKDPTALNIPVLFPNQERELFMYLKDFKFNDGEGFDFSGDMSSNGKGGLLAN